MKVKGKMITTFLLSCFLIAVFFFFEMETDLAKWKFVDIENGFMKQMEHIDFSMNTYLDQIRDDLALLSLSKEVKEKDASGFTSYLSINKEENKVSLQMSSKEANIKNLFKGYVETHSSAKAVYMARENGSFVGKDEEYNADMSYDPRKEEWYIKAKEKPDEIIITTPNVFMSEDDATLALAKALVNEDGEVYGVVGMDISLDFVKDYILALRMGSSGWVALVDTDGRIMSAGDDSLINQNINWFKPYPFRENSIFSKFDLERVRVEMKDKNLIVFRYKCEELDFDLISFVDQEDIMHEVKGVIGQSLRALIGALIALSVLVIFIISKIVLKPLSRLQKKTEKISRTGDLTELIDIKSKDEIGALANSFNEMIKSLAEKEADLTTSQAELTEYRDHLEEIVKDRTERLKKLTVAIEQNPSGILIADVDRTIEYVNDKFCEVRGFPREQIEGTKLMMPDSAGEFSAILDKVKNGEIWRGDMKRKQANGEVIWENIIIAPMVNDGNITHFVTLVSDITNRKKMETQLAESEQRLQNILDSSPAIMYMKNLKGEYIYANEMFKSSYRVNEVVGMKDEDIFDADFCVGKMKESDMEVLNKKGIISKDMIIEVDGENRVFAEYKFPLFNLFGNVDMLGGWSLDITDRLKAEQQSKLLLESVGEGIVGIDKEGMITFINPAVTKVLGYTQAELIGASLHEKIMHSHADGEKYEAESSPVYLAYTKGNECTVRDEVLWKKDGTSVNIEYNSVPIVENGEITGAVVAFKDIDELAALNRNFVAILESSDDMISLVDKDGKIIMANKVLSDFVGADHWTEIIGKTWEEILDKNLAKEFTEDDGEVFENDLVITNRMLEFAENGKQNWVRINKRVIKDKFGKKIGVYTLATDVTDLMNLNQELELAKNDAEAATRAKSDFLANMSHEIRTPMNAIIGLNNLLDKTALKPKQHDYVEKIGRSAKNLLGIINDILDFSKIEAGKLDIEHIDFNLEEVMENLSNVIGLKAYKQGLEFVISRNPDIPVNLVGDPLRLNQILLNLANNAIKFTEDGEVVVKAELDSRTEDSVMVRFSVIDTGIGMSEEQSSKLFRAFSQADTSTTRKYGGTGLGLSISKQLVSMMHGEISVESEEGEGSVFTFTAEFEISKKAKTKKLIPDKLKQLKVLVVDDNESARIVLDDYLNDFNFERELVSSGDKAIKEIERAVNNSDESNYDLILMDWKMPGLNGIETWERIKNSLPRNILPKIILVTSHSREDIMKQIEEQDISAVLMKPVGQSILYDTILDVFNVEKEFDEDEVQIPEIESINLDNIRGAKLLLVEDNEINQQVAKETLEAEGFEITIAENGLEALEKLGEENEFEAVLMDLQMPKMDGYEATRVLRKRGIKIPIIALSADAMEGTRARVSEAGMDDYITKPIEIKELFTALSKWLEVKEREVNTNKNNAEQNKEIETNISIEKVRDILTEFKVDESISRLGGKVKSYLEILKKFKNNNTHSVKDVVEFLSNNHKHEAERLLHTLKGVASNIGATTLQARARDAEAELLKQENSEITEKLNEKFSLLQKNLELVFTEIDEVNKLQSSKSSTGGAHEFDSAKVLELLSQMNEYLDDYDSEASRVYDEIYEEAEGSDIFEDVKKIGEVLGQYEFEEALELSQELMSKLK